MYVNLSTPAMKAHFIFAAAKLVIYHQITQEYFLKIYKRCTKQAQNVHFLLFFPPISMPSEQKNSKQ